MNALRQGKFRLATLISIAIFAFAVAGCDDGDDGNDGPPGPAGADGSDGVACWDLNENGVGDLPDEDLNGDGVVDVLDCNALASGAYDAEALHTGYFTEKTYEGTQSCLACHGDIGDDMIGKAHFTWKGTAAGIEGFEAGQHGKIDLINNFCIAVPTNEGRCAQCHAGYGYTDDTFDFGDRNSVDCLICHDQSGTYKKGLTNGGLPDVENGVNLQKVAQSVAQNGGIPTMKNCIVCHANAGGGDNVKHGDLAMALLEATKDDDVHMGSVESGGEDFDCVACHKVKRTADKALVDHGIGGMIFHSVDDGEMETCGDCHGDRNNIHAGKSVEGIVAQHTTLACQVCHIPAIARKTSTKTEWYWATAGQDIPEEDIPKSEDGRNMYDKKKGNFVWTKNVRPELLYYDGKWNRMMINTNEQYTSVPVDLGSPSADYTTPGAMIYPFKKMIGNQVADAGNNTMLVPHLFGSKGGPNPYWKVFDWDLALQDGAAYTGQTYSGAFDFVETYMYLTVNHEVAPKEQAFGNGGACGDCHGGDQIDWAGLGWDGDPVTGGDRP